MHSHLGTQSETDKQIDFHNTPPFTIIHTIYNIYNIHVVTIINRKNNVSNTTEFCLCIYFLFKKIVTLPTLLSSYILKIVHHSHNARF